MENCASSPQIIDNIFFTTMTNTGTTGEFKFRDRNEFLNTAYSYKDKLIAVAIIRLRDKDLADDAVSEVIIKSAEKRFQLKDSSKLLSWLIRILINHCNDYLRQQKKFKYKNTIGQYDYQQVQIVDKNAKPEDKIDVASEIERVLDVMLSIQPEEHRDVLIYYYYRKFSYAEIAEMLDVPEGTVKSRLNRARPSLVRALKDVNIGKDELVFIKDLEEWPFL
jgi:RNA polymerase sigma-70 factor (ECF subfamily)